MWADEPEVAAFLRHVADLCPDPGVVVEVGSYRMHDHDPRPLWPSARYVGVDCRPGPGVDVVAVAHEAPGLDGTAGLVLSISALEHDPHWKATIAAMVRFARPGGHVAITCPEPGWPEHEHEASPTPGYYGNLTVDQIAAALEAESVGFVSWTVRHRTGWPRACVIAARRG